MQRFHWAMYTSASKANEYLANTIQTGYKSNKSLTDPKQVDNPDQQNDGSQIPRDITRREGQVGVDRSGSIHAVSCCGEVS